LQKHAKNFGGNEQSNLVIGFHGGCVENMQVAMNNFKRISEEELDDGWYGKGIYFTQFIGYGDKYSRFRKTFFSGQIPIIMSYVLLGNLVNSIYFNF
jgi:hypothetical protein